MKRLLSIELQKIWMNKASRVLTLTYFILLSFIALSVSIKYDIGPIHVDPAEMGIFNFPFIWHFNTYFATWFQFFLGVVIVSMMANEYSYGTLKQNLIDGLRKDEFILSKFLTVVFFALCSTIFIFIMSLILGLCYSSYNEFGIIFSDLEYLLAYFIELVGFFSFCLFVGILIKRSAFALGFILVWRILEWIIMFQVLPRNIVGSYISQILPLESMSNLIVEPFTRLSLIKTIGNQIGIAASKDYSVHWYSILIALIWTSLFVCFSYKILKNRDL
ncbi:ABC-type transport system involved in multi-copper enzyme maturation permease subunit [Flavobacterium sp. 270]|uniref:ABC transporter permease n=1 Tax=Flavobacterium sp. 270 TaxID=2512114 RepID=UPI0010654125|nr:ABC transporter permease [Flavobacterium sp. 270]TDW48659.1 ABC-type transport system involved in multi-copper enzyme maturation permease subunit [Flavobacterium sp. 270]